MPDKLLKIGEMAQLTHVSVQTLRLYDKNKLLEPGYKDEETGYRYYTLDQCAKLDLIHALKSCRLSLKDIRSMFESTVDADMVDILSKQIAVLQDEIDDLLISRNSLSNILRNYRVLNTLPPFGTVFYEHFPERLADVQETEYDFFSSGPDAYEKMLIHMQDYLHVNNLPPSYFVNVGTLMAGESFAEGRFSSHQAFVFVDEFYPKKDSLRVLPGGTYACMVSDDVSLEARHAKKLRQAIRREGMDVCGDYLCEVLTNFPLNHSERLVYKIQVPVVRGA